MKNLLKTSLSTLAILGFGVLMVSQTNAGSTGDINTKATTDVKLTVTGGALTIGIDDAELDLGTVYPSLEDQTKSGTFTNDFRVEDLKGSKSGYYTTVEVTDLTGDFEGTTYSIAKNNVKFTANEVETITGASNSDIKATLDDIISTAKTYIFRNQNTTPGLLGKYGTKPTITVTVPANTPATEYKGTITYTLYEPGPAAN